MLRKQNAIVTKKISLEIRTQARQGNKQTNSRHWLKIILTERKKARSIASKEAVKKFMLPFGVNLPIR